MKKDDLARKLSRELFCTQGAALRMINKTIQIIEDALVDGEKVQLTGFGTFEVKNRAPRMGRNPKKNIPVPIPAKKVPYFTPGRELKGLVEGDYHII